MNSRFLKGARDHPRSRGEYRSSSPDPTALPGSSPLSRGIPGSTAVDPDANRIIPALAGNTSKALLPRRGAWDHPRSRGEYILAAWGVSARAGSSPLSRGIHSLPESNTPSNRIIPALAGNTSSTWPHHAISSDHPRSRGEYAPRRAVALPVRGSSPLSRGIPPPKHQPPPQPRIIPALAGNTRPGDPERSARGDHPRSRGEYHDIVPLPDHLRGSSPLSRGIPVEIVGWFCRGRDHPRSRGEYEVHQASACCFFGSSPLSRGIRLTGGVKAESTGIIPALAGNTCSGYRRGWRCPDHPRSRGEYMASRMPRVLRGGSSPLSRGIPAGVLISSSRARIIPALAGNTGPARTGCTASPDHPRSRGEYGGYAGEDASEDGSSPLSRGIHLRRRS